MKNKAIAFLAMAFAALAQTSTDRGPGALGGPAVLNADPHRTIRVTEFGCVADGKTDNTSCLNAIGGYAKAHDGSTILFPPGTYVYQAGYGPAQSWLAGVLNVTIVGYGAHLKAISPPSSGHYLIFGLFADPHSNSTVTGYAIKTVASGSRAVMTTSAGDAGGFAAGNDVIIQGWDQQYCNGAPENSKYFEYARVVSANSRTGVITLGAPVRNSYDSRWRGSTCQGFLTGKPNILNLSRTGKSAYQIAHSIRVFGMDFTSGTAPKAEADVYAAGSLYWLFEDVKADWFVPTVSGTVEMRHSSLGGLEGDKLVDKVIIEGSSLTGATFILCSGCNLIQVTDSDITSPGVDLQARVIVFRGNTITAPPGTVYSMLAANTNWSGKRFEAFANRFTNLQQAGSGPVGRLISLGQPYTVRVLGAPAPTSRTISVKYDDAAYSGFPVQGDIGSILKQQGGKKWGRVTAYYDNGTSMTLEATFSAPPVAGEVYEYNALQSAVIEANTTADAQYPGDDFGPHKYGWPNSLPMETYGIADSLQIGGLDGHVKTVTANYNATRLDRTILCDASEGAVGVLLPAPAANFSNPSQGPYPGQWWVIKKIDATANVCTVDGHGANIDSAARQAITARGESLTVQWDYLSSRYWIVGSH